MLLSRKKNRHETFRACGPGAFEGQARAQGVHLAVGEISRARVLAAVERHAVHAPARLRVVGVVGHGAGEAVAGAERVLHPARKRRFVEIAAGLPAVALPGQEAPHEHAQLFGEHATPATLHAPVAEAVGLHTQPQHGHGRGPVGEEGDGPAHGLRPVERGSRSFHDFHRTDGQHVHFDERVVVEHAHGPHGQAVFGAQKTGVGRNRLADAHHVLLVAEVGHHHAGGFVDDFVEVRRFGVLNQRGREPGDGHRRFGAALGLAAGRDDDGLEVFHLRREGQAQDLVAGVGRTGALPGGVAHAGDCQAAVGGGVQRKLPLRVGDGAPAGAFEGDGSPDEGFLGLGVENDTREGAGLGTKPEG